MKPTQQQVTYRLAASFMLLVVMPATLLIGSVIVWLDPDETTGLVGAILNNGLPLYVLSVVPGLLVSTLHTRYLQTQHGVTRTTLLFRSMGLGAFLGLALGALVLLVVFGQLNTLMWPVMLWGAIVGIVYGAGVVLVHRRRASAVLPGMSP